jgi:hypothetical protein
MNPIPCSLFKVCLSPFSQTFLLYYQIPFYLIMPISI